MAQEFARVHRFRDGSCTIETPWVQWLTPGLVARWKAAIPAPHRRYDPDTHAWRFGPIYADLACRLAAEAFVLLVDEQSSQSAPGGRPAGRVPLAAERHYEALCVTPAAPKEVIHAAYRAWCKLCHPDTLPATERERAHRRMLEINSALEALRAEGAA